MKFVKFSKLVGWWLAAKVGMLAVVFAASYMTRVDVAAEKMPATCGLSDDVQYYAPDPEFKLSREAAALAEARANAINEQQN